MRKNYLIIILFFIINLFSFKLQTIEIIGKGGSSSNLIFPTGIYLNSNKLYLSNYIGNTISILDINLNKWYEFGCFGEENSKFNSPNSIILGEDKKIYIVDTNNSRIQVFDENYNFVSTFGKERLSSPIDLSIYNGKVYITDFDSSKILIYDLNGKFISEFGKKGENNGEFNGPLGIYINKNGNIFICDSKNRRVQIFDINFNFIKKINIDGRPSDVFVDDSDKIYISDYYNIKIYVYKDFGNTKLKEFKINTDAYWFFNKAPISIFITKEYNIIYTVPWENRVDVISQDGNFIRSYGEPLKDGLFLYPNSLTISNDEKIYIVDNMNNSISIFDNNKNFIKKINYAFEHPNGISIDDNGNIYTISKYIGEISSFDKNLNFRFKIENFNNDSFLFPQNIFVYRGKIYVVDSYNDRIVIFSSDGNFIKTFGKYGKGLYEFDYPISIFIDNYENIFIIDNGNKRILIYDKNFNFLYEGKNLNLYNPTSIYLYENYLFILDSESCDIKIFNWDGNILKFIKTFGEFGGPLTKISSLRTTELNYSLELGKFFEPNYLFIYKGFIYVCDSGNRRVQKIPLSLVLGEPKPEKLTITLWIDKSKALINEKEVYIDPNNTKISPFIVPPGRTVVPIRFISESFGAEVTWENDTKTIRIYLQAKNIKITLQVGNKLARVNDKIITLDSPPLIKEGRTFVPLRFISESFGANVKWFANEKKIVIELSL
ncbi:MAG: stalk domain-containing protein [Caldisericia bacterium]|nr:stalk domain-containing protein [Caldisericia bacterium]